MTTHTPAGLVMLKAFLDADGRPPIDTIAELPPAPLSLVFERHYYRIDLRLHCASLIILGSGLWQ